MTVAFERERQECDILRITTSKRLGIAALGIGAKASSISVLRATKAIGRSERLDDCFVKRTIRSVTYFLPKEINGDTQLTSRDAIQCIFLDVRTVGQ